MATDHISVKNLLFLQDIQDSGRQSFETNTPHFKADKLSENSNDRLIKIT